MIQLPANSSTKETKYNVSHHSIGLSHHTGCCFSRTHYSQRSAWSCYAPQAQLWQATEPYLSQQFARKNLRLSNTAICGDGGDGCWFGDLHSYICFRVCSLLKTAAPERHPTARGRARPSHDRPSKQPWVPPVEEGAPQSWSPGCVANNKY